MENDEAGIEHIVDAVRAFVVEPSAGLGDAELLARCAAWERLARLVDAVRVEIAGEVGHRSRASLGDEGLSRAENFATPATLLSAITGASRREARARLELGARLRGSPMLGGQAGPPPFPNVSSSLSAGMISVDAAGVIARECAGLLQRGCAQAEVADAETVLVDAAIAGPVPLPADDVLRLAVRVRELLDPDGAEPRAERHEQLRSFTQARATDGMYRGTIALTPEQCALWLGALQAVTSPRVRPRFCGEDEFVADQTTTDTRTTPQRLADAATDLISRAATSPDQPRIAGSPTTVNVHVSLQDLATGRAVGWVDGIEEPLPASTIDRLRCHAPHAVTVFGDRGEVLHHGKTRRVFSPAQNRALAARDGGCVWRGCDRPPSWCETHHVDPWQTETHPGGRTDIDNGALLCHFHHRHLHATNWQLTMRDGVPHLIPPKWIDPAQTPLPTTRRRTTGPPGLVPAA